jgi:arginase
VLYQLSYLAAARKYTHLPAQRLRGVAHDRLSWRTVTMPAGKHASVIGAPLDLGQSRRGVDMGPSAIRYAGLFDRLTDMAYDVLDRGNVAAPEPEALRVQDVRARYLAEILDACAALAALVEEAVRAGSRPLVLGGDHAVALGTLAGLRAASGEPGGVVWIDAHGDLNTPDTSPSGNVHGMPLAAALGRSPSWFEHPGLLLPAVDPARVALVGVRALDAAERAYLRDADVRVFTMSDIDRIGIERAMREALDRVAGPGFVHVSVDLDALDPEVAPGVGTPVRGGLTYREAHLACELVAESGVVGSFEVVEVNPILDRENTTALTAVELVASALGKTIV